MPVKRTIWIVDDDEATLDLMREILTSEGYLVAVFAEEEAFSQAIAVKPLPQLIFLDVVMPRVSGLILANRLKELPKTAHIPLILMSANTRIIDQEHQTTAEDILTKPFDIGHLLEKVNKYV